VDGPPDARNWIERETLDVPCDGESYSSMAKLDNAVQYLLRASGTCAVSDNPPLYDADAEYSRVNTVSPVDTIDVNGTIYDIGLAINYSGTRAYKWGDYAADNIYEMPWTGQGATISALFIDRTYDNNTGSLTLTILESN